MNIEAMAGIEAVEIVGHFINGANVAGHGRSQDVFNPAIGKVVRRVALASKEVVEEAIAAAEAAFPRLAQYAGRQACPHHVPFQATAGTKCRPRRGAAF